MVKYSKALDLSFRALAGSTRRAIVERLSRGEASVTELARPLRMSLPAIHKHLRVLESAGLMVCRKQGRVKRCHLNPRALDVPAAWLERHRALWRYRLRALARHL